MAHRAPVEIAAYSPAWPLRFAAERDRLATAFPPTALRIEHIGSTSVPGLGAKPIIDILVGADSLATIEACLPALAALGYQYVREHEAALPQRRFLAWPQTRPRQFHVHAVATAGRFFVEHLRFRDALRSDARLAAAYHALKVDLAARFGDDREGYTEAKGEFIRNVLERSA